MAKAKTKTKTKAKAKAEAKAEVKAEVKAERILVVDDEAPMREGFKQTLGGSKTGYDVTTAENGEEALQLLKKSPFDVVITDLRMPGMSGLDLLDHTRKATPNLPVIVVTAYGDIPTAVDAMKKGAFDFITKPFKIEAVREAVGRALIHSGLHAEKQHDDPKEVTELLASFPEIIGRSPVLLKVLKVIRKIAPTRSTVMILGETGTGKELIARALHRLSKRAKGPMVITSGAIPEGLLETEMFGHARGAFTGAVGEKMGYFEAANEGTLFLDEVADLPPKMQVELLRAVQEGEIMRVGDSKSRKVDVRLCAATNKDLRAEIKAGRFREDLFYRLNVIAVTLPPLRDRPDDIPPLVQHFLDKWCQRQQAPAFQITPRAMDALKAYSWRGNIRELEHVIERTLSLASGSTIDVADIPDEFR